jgi:hypothetical protein
LQRTVERFFIYRLGSFAAAERNRYIQLAEGCEAGTERSQSSFTDIGKGGLPPRPDDPLNSDLFSAEQVALQSEPKVAPEGTIPLTQRSIQANPPIPSLNSPFPAKATDGEKMPKSL